MHAHGTLPGGFNDVQRFVDDALEQAVRARAAMEKVQEKLVATRERVMQAQQLLARSDEVIQRSLLLLKGEGAVHAQVRRRARRAFR